MTDSHYTKEDSDEVRRTYFNALRRGGKPDTRKTLCTFREFKDFERQGRDMSKYEVLQDFQKRMRNQEMEKKKKEWEAKRGTHIENHRKSNEEPF